MLSCQQQQRARHLLWISMNTFGAIACKLSGYLSGHFFLFFWILNINFHTCNHSGVLVLWFWFNQQSSTFVRQGALTGKHFGSFYICVSIIYIFYLHKKDVRPAVQFWIKQLFLLLLFSTKQANFSTSTYTAGPLNRDPLCRLRAIACIQTFCQVVIPLPATVGWFMGVVWHRLIMPS